MSLKDLFKENRIDSDVTENVPYVIFDDINLELEVGRWLGILSFSEISKKIKTKIYDTEDNVICNKFGMLLSMIGIDTNEVCVLDNYNQSNSSFDCRFFYSQDSAKISLIKNEHSEVEKKVKIDYKNMSKTYNYRDYGNSLIELNLEHYTLTNPDNGNKYYRLFSTVANYITLSNSYEKLSIYINESEDLENYGNRNHNICLTNEDELKKYLLELSFPVEIHEVYKKICETSLGQINDYCRIILEVQKKAKNGDNVTTDLISIGKGQLLAFMITRDGKTVSIDNKGNWSYVSSEVIVNGKDEQGTLININNNDQDIKASKLREINNQVNQIRKLSKTIFK